MMCEPGPHEGLYLSCELVASGSFCDNHRLYDQTTQRVRSADNRHFVNIRMFKNRAFDLDCADRPTC